MRLKNRGCSNFKVVGCIFLALLIGVAFMGCGVGEKLSMLEK